MKMFLFVALGGAVGASARYAVGMLTLQFSNGQFPWETLAVNVAGSFVLGVLAACLAYTWSPSAEFRAFLVEKRVQQEAGRDHGVLSSAHPGRARGR